MSCNELTELYSHVHIKISGFKIQNAGLVFDVDGGVMDQPDKIDRFLNLSGLKGREFWESATHILLHYLRIVPK